MVELLIFNGLTKTRNLRKIKALKMKEEKNTDSINF